jgi:hypothetical protein
MPHNTRERQDIILRSEFSLKSFFDMDSDGNNEVTKEEFLLYKVLHMNLVEPEIIARIERQFNVRYQTYISVNTDSNPP